MSKMKWGNLRYSAQRTPHLQPLEPAFFRPSLAIPHHHSAQPFPRPLRVCEDSPNARTLFLWVT